MNSVKKKCNNYIQNQKVELYIFLNEQNAPHKNTTKVHVGIHI